MKILILTNYFTPDFSAGSFRMQALLDAALRHDDPDIQIDIYTTFPNRYGAGTEDLVQLEIQKNVKIHRTRIPSHQGQMFLQSLAYIVFFVRVLIYTKRGDYDLVFATSSRLFTAFLGALIARRNSAVLFLDIRDLFTDTLNELFPSLVKLLLLPPLKFIEKWTLGSADAINVVSPGFVRHVKLLAKTPHISVITNGIDEDFLMYRPKIKRPSGAKTKILYAGNIGDGQGLENIIPKAAKRLEEFVSFKIIGAGGRGRELDLALLEANCSNVEFIGPIERRKLIAEYDDADILFLHLNDYTAFEKVLPSKIFEYASTGKPIVAGVSGYAKKLLETEVVGSFVFQPNDVDAFIEIVNSLKSTAAEYDRTEFKVRYARVELMDELFKAIINIEKINDI